MRPLVVVLGLAGLVLLGALPAHATPQHASADARTPMGIELDGRNLKVFDDQAAERARRAGVNTVLTDNRRLTRRQRARVAALARRFGFSRVALPHTPTASLAAGEARCANLRRRNARNRCTLLAGSTSVARRLSRSPHVDLVVVRLDRLPALGTARGGRATMIALVDIGRGGALDRARWGAAIREAVRNSSFALAVRPVAPRPARFLTAFVGVLGSNDLTPPAAVTANLWVSASGGSCVRSSVLMGFDAGRACASFAAAYAAALSGDVVGVTGTLGPQYFAGGYGASQPEGSKLITFRGEPGNVVRQVHSGSSNITYDGLNLDAGGVKTFGAVFENGGGDNVTFRNGRIGNVVDEKAALADGNHFTFDNVVFHDAVLRTNGVHMECVYAIVVPNFTVRNSTFTNCAVMDLFFTYGDWWSPLPPPYGNVTIEGNSFATPRDSNGSCCHYYGLYAGNTASPGPGAIDGWRVRNNWFESSFAGFDGRTITNSVFCGNTGVPPNSWRRPCR